MHIVTTYTNIYTYMMYIIHVRTFAHTYMYTCIHISTQTSTTSTHISIHTLKSERKAMKENLNGAYI